MMASADERPDSQPNCMRAHLPVAPPDYLVKEVDPLATCATFTFAVIGFAADGVAREAFPGCRDHFAPGRGDFLLVTARSRGSGGLSPTQHLQR